MPSVNPRRTNFLNPVASAIISYSPGARKGIVYALEGSDFVGDFARVGISVAKILA
jgi:hypothetical protein